MDKGGRGGTARISFVFQERERERERGSYISINTRQRQASARLRRGRWMRRRSVVLAFRIGILEEETIVRVFVDDRLAEISTVFAHVL